MTPRIEPLTVAATSSIFCTRGYWFMDGDPDLALEAMPRISTAKRPKQHEDIAEVSVYVCGRSRPNVSRWNGRGNTITTTPQPSSCVPQSPLSTMQLEDTGSFGESSVGRCRRSALWELPCETAGQPLSCWSTRAVLRLCSNERCRYRRSSSTLRTRMSWPRGDQAKLLKKRVF